MTAPTDAPTRYVLGLDPLVARAHLAAFAWTGGDTPPVLIKTVEAPKAGDPTPAGHVARMTALVDELLSTVDREGLPELVVLMRPLVGLPHQDDSGPRRMMVAGEVERRLVTLGVPVGEVAPKTLQKWVLGSAATHRTVDKVAIRVRDIWNPDSLLQYPGYRLSTIAVAATAAVVLGLPTAKPADPVADHELVSAMALPKELKANALKRLERQEKEARQARAVAAEKEGAA